MAKAAVEKSTRVLRTKKPSTSLPSAKPAKPSLISDVKPSAPKTAAVKPPSSKAAGKRKSVENDEAAPAPVKKSKKVAKDEEVDVKEDEKPAKIGKKAASKSEGKAAEKVKVEAEDKKGKKKEQVDEVAPAKAEVKEKAGKAKKAKAKPKSPSPIAQDSEAEDDPEGEDGKAQDFEEKDEHAFGFSTDDDDSSDEELDQEPDGIEVSKLPTIAKDDEVVKRKLEKAKRKPTEDRGVIYLGRIPHGFYEAQMKGYFSQFGDVTRLRLSRNKRTGRSKHYAFIEFASSSVAQIVAETMDNYLLMGHILTCKVIPKDEVHPELWVGANRKWRAVPNDRVARVQHNKPRTAEEQEKAEKRLLKRQAQKKRKLEEAGIKYDFEAVAYKKKPKADS